MMSSRHSSRAEAEEQETAIDAEIATSEEVSSSSQDPLNESAGMRSSPPPVPPPPPPPIDGAPPEYSDQKPPEYHEAVGLLQAHLAEEVNANPPPDYVELTGLERRRSDNQSVSPSEVELEAGSRRASVADAPVAEFEVAEPPVVPEVDVERGSARIRRRFAPVYDYVSERRWLLVVMPLVLSGLTIFLAIFPVSFEYIHYHDIALKRSKWTGWVDFSRTYYAGCYVIGPEMEFLRFPATTQVMHLDLSVTSSSALSYHINIAVVYQLNSSQLPQLYRKFAYDYVTPLRAIIGSTVKNKAVSINMDAWFLERRKKENEIEDIIKNRVRPYHIDVIHAYLHDIVFPRGLPSRMMRRVVLNIKSDTEYYILEERIESKRTDEMTNAVLNTANEVNAAAVASANKIEVEANAAALKRTTASNGQGLNSVKSNASLTTPDQVLSFYFLTSLSHLAANERLVVAPRNATKSYNRATGSFAQTLAVAAAGLAKVKP